MMKKDRDKMVRIFKTKKAMIEVFLLVLMMFGILPVVKVQAAAPKTEKSYKVWLYDGTEGAKQTDQEIGRAHV